MRKCPICSKSISLEHATFCSRACAQIQDRMDEERRLSRQLYEEQQYHPVFQDKAQRIGGRMKNSFREE